MHGTLCLQDLGFLNWGRKHMRRHVQICACGVCGCKVLALNADVCKFVLARLGALGVLNVCVDVCTFVVKTLGF